MYYLKLALQCRNPIWSHKVNVLHQSAKTEVLTTLTAKFEKNNHNLRPCLIDSFFLIQTFSQTLLTLSAGISFEVVHNEL